MRVWTVSEAKAGTLTQCLGVARLIDPKPKKVIVKRELPAWRQGLLSPYRRRTSADPQLIISCGGKALSHAQALAASCAVRPFTVHLAMPQPAYRDVFDMAFVSRHDLTRSAPGLAQHPRNDRRSASDLHGCAAEHARAGAAALGAARRQDLDGPGGRPEPRLSLRRCDRRSADRRDRSESRGRLDRPGHHIAPFASRLASAAFGVEEFSVSLCGTVPAKTPTGICWRRRMLCS